MGWPLPDYHKDDKLMNPTDWSGIVYAYFFVGTATIYGIWRAFQHAVRTMVDESVEQICKRLDKIDYALYNDGRTGLINKVDCLIENQQIIKIDVEVMKAKYEN
jgi:hypothetical protein